ncbi:MAG: O-antigen ligase family protein [Bacteroidota bacterium]
MKLSLQVINYIYLTLAILWGPIQRGFLHIDGKGRIMFVLTILVFLLNILHDRTFIKKQVLSKPAVFWGLWVIFSIINQQINGYHEEISFPFYVIHQLFTPFLIMVLAAKETMRNPQKTAQLFTIVFTIFALLSVTILGGESERFEERYTGELGNIGPLNTMYIVFFGGLLFAQNKIKLKWLIPLLVFAFTAIAMAATRKAFGAAIVMTLTLILSQLKYSARNLILSIALAIGFYAGINYAIENTTLGERFEQGVEVGIERNTTGIEALSVLGDRVFFYIKGWEVFKDNPVNGIGLRNFMHDNHYQNVLHSEYMVQLAECGIIGSILFLLFYFWIGKNIVRQWKRNYNNSRPVLWILAGGFGAVLFINLTAWTYDFEQYFAAFGVMIGYIKHIQNHDRNTQHRQ